MAFRFVHTDDLTDPRLAADFLSDDDAGLRPTAREKHIPELRDGRSAYGSLRAARRIWEGLRQLAEERDQPVRVGHFIAEVVLTADEDFAVEDLAEPDEHLTIWGAAERLRRAVRRIYDAHTEEE
jgi:hypothetical protein